MDEHGAAGVQPGAELVEQRRVDHGIVEGRHHRLAADAHLAESLLADPSTVLLQGNRGLAAVAIAVERLQRRGTAAVGQAEAQRPRLALAAHLQPPLLAQEPADLLHHTAGQGTLATKLMQIHHALLEQLLDQQVAQVEHREPRFRHRGGTRRPSCSRLAVAEIVKGGFQEHDRPHFLT